MTVRSPRAGLPESSTPGDDAAEDTSADDERAEDRLRAYEDDGEEEDWLDEHPGGLLGALLW